MICRRWPRIWWHAARPSWICPPRCSICGARTSTTITGIGHSRLRQIVIGGEPVRPSAVDKWVDTAAAERSRWCRAMAPTETTVVVTYLPIIDRGRVVERDARRRLGRPIVPNTVVIAFGEVVVVGGLVADGYLGLDGAGFGSVTPAGGRRQRTFATADRVTMDGAGYPVFAGRNGRTRQDLGQARRHRCDHPTHRGGPDGGRRRRRASRRGPGSLVRDSADP